MHFFFNPAQVLQILSLIRTQGLFISGFSPFCCAANSNTHSHTQCDIWGKVCREEAASASHDNNSASQQPTSIIISTNICSEPQP